MNLRAIISTSIVALALTLCYSLPAFALGEVLLPLVSSGNGVWVLKGSNFVNIAGMDITIGYDSSTLSNPRMVSGGLVAGSFFVPNVNVPGNIRLVIANVTKPINGNGVVATVTFDVKSGAGKITAISALLIRSDSSKAPVIASYSNPLEPTAVINPQGTGDQNTGTVNQNTGTGNQNTGTVTNQPIIVGGTVTMPTDTPAATENKAQPAAPEYREEPRSEQPVVAREPEAKPQEAQAKSPEKKLESQKNVLGRFRDYKGELSSKSLIALFDRDEKSGVRQEPAFLLADGKTVLKVVVPSVAGKQAPNFALKKARLVSLKKDVNNNWVVEARPEKGAYDASLTMLLDESMVELPLVVAPKVDIDLDKSGKITEDGFNRFLKERGTEKAPKYDLNGDGRRDYIDDYIFTANYLAYQNNKAKEKVKVKEKEKEKEAKPTEKPADNKAKGKPSKSKIKEQK